MQVQYSLSAHEPKAMWQASDLSGRLLHAYKRLNNNEMNLIFPVELLPEDFSLLCFFNSSSHSRTLSLAFHQPTRPNAIKPSSPIQIMSLTNPANWPSFPSRNLVRLTMTT